MTFLALYGFVTFICTRIAFGFLGILLYHRVRCAHDIYLTPPFSDINQLIILLYGYEFYREQEAPVGQVD